MSLYNTTKRGQIPLDPKAIGQRIAAARESRGWTQTDLARACGLNYVTVWSAERGARIPKLQTLATIAAHLRRSLDWLAAGVSRRGSLWTLLRTGLLVTEAGGAANSPRCPPDI